MTTLERIRKLCAEKGISISRLEKDLNFSNGSISKAKTYKSERLNSIANYFGVSMEYLLSGETVRNSLEDTMISFHSQVQMDKTFQINYDDLELLNNMNKNHKKRQLFKQITDLSDEDVELLLAVAERFAK